MLLEIRYLYKIHTFYWTKSSRTFQGLSRTHCKKEHWVYAFSSSTTTWAILFWRSLENLGWIKWAPKFKDFPASTDQIENQTKSFFYRNTEFGPYHKQFACTWTLLLISNKIYFNWMQILLLQFMNYQSLMNIKKLSQLHKRTQNFRKAIHSVQLSTSGGSWVCIYMYMYMYTPGSGKPVVQT